MDGSRNWMDVLLFLTMNLWWFMNNKIRNDYTKEMQAVYSNNHHHHQHERLPTAGYFSYRLYCETDTVSTQQYEFY